MIIIIIIITIVTMIIIIALQRFNAVCVLGCFDGKQDDVD